VKSAQKQYRSAQMALHSKNLKANYDKEIQLKEKMLLYLEPI
jgi:hypothetical protein